MTGVAAIVAATVAAIAGLSAAVWQALARSYDRGHAVGSSAERERRARAYAMAREQMAARERLVSSQLETTVNESRAGERRALDDEPTEAELRGIVDASKDLP